MKKKTKKTVKRSTVHNKLWPIFSKYVRLRDCLATTGNVDYCICYTCGEVTEWAKLDAGHAFTRKCISLKYDEKLVRGQCKGCNGYGKGEQALFLYHLEEDHGREFVDWARGEYKNWKADKGRKVQTIELLEMIPFYEQKLNQLNE